MAPNVEEWSASSDLDVEVSGGAVCPSQDLAPAHAWVDDERDCFLTKDHEPPIMTSKDHVSITLGVPNICPKSKKVRNGKPKVKTKFQKRKERLCLIRPPFFIIFMIVVNLCFQLCGDRELMSALQWQRASWREQPWRALTYSVMHASMGHFALNALVALFVGWRLEYEQGWVRVCSAWLGGVVGGAAGAGLLQPQSTVVGSSAAVYALLTAHLPNVALRFGHIPLWWFRPLSVLVLGISEAVGVVLRAGAPPPELVQPAGAAHWYQGLGSDENIAWAAHAFGAVAGLTVGFVFFNGENRAKTLLKACRVMSSLALIGAALTALAFYVYGLALDYL